MKGRKYKSSKFKVKLNKRKNKKNTTKKKGGAKANNSGRNINNNERESVHNSSPNLTYESDYDQESSNENTNNAATMNRIKEYAPGRSKRILLDAAGTANNPIKQEKFGKRFEMGIKGGGSILVIGLIGGLVAILASQ